MEIRSDILLVLGLIKEDLGMGWDCIGVRVILRVIFVCLRLGSFLIIMLRCLLGASRNHTLHYPLISA